jgi:hypothetical protein
MAEEQVVLGYDALLQVFENLRKADQRKTIKQSLATASKPMRDEAKRAYQSATISKQKGYASYFKTKVGKRNPVAVTGIAYYKARWINWGTDERFTNGVGKKQKVRAYRGKVKATYFFANTYESHADTTIDRATTLLVEALNQIANPQPTE